MNAPTGGTRSRGVRRRVEEPEAPDLQTQLEELLNQVWASERDWRFDDRIDLALRCFDRPLS